MPIWLIEPRDPLIVRDGKPFDNVPGARATTRPFPFPSTTAGATRTRTGLDVHGLFDTTQDLEALKKVAVRGPFLVELDERGAIKSDGWFAPAPADALLLNCAKDAHGHIPQDKARRLQLLPRALPPGAKTDLDKNLFPVGLPFDNPDPGKPFGKAPSFWKWSAFLDWLQAPTGSEVKIKNLGLRGLPSQARTHVRLEKETQTAMEGAIFQTRGLEFTSAAESAGGIRRWDSCRRLALALETSATLRPGFAPLAGERRLVTWHQSSTPLPVCPAALREAVAHSGACRLLLLTPAYFEEEDRGFMPRRLLKIHNGVTPHLRAVACGRPEVISGWDFQKGKPKPARRLVPAGSVYFLRLQGQPDAIEEWIDSYWLQSVCDTEQDCHDGFGLAAFGLWHDDLPEVEASAKEQA